MTLSEAPPPQLGHAPVAIVPYHLNTYEDFFCTGNTETSQCAPAPNGGRAGARGVIIPHETGFLQTKNPDIRKGDITGFPGRSSRGSKNSGGFFSPSRSDDRSEPKH